MWPHSQSKCTVAKATTLQVTQPYSMATTLSDLTATALQLPLCASVSLVLAILGPPSAHGCHHNAVHVEPGLTQRRRVGLAQTALQHIEKGLTHHLKEPKTTHKYKHTEKACTYGHKTNRFFSLAHSFEKLLIENFLKSCTIGCNSYSKWLCVDSHCLMLPPKVEQKILQGVKVVQVADCCIDHKHHLQSRPQTQFSKKQVQRHTYTQAKSSELCMRRVSNVCILVVVTVVN